MVCYLFTLSGPDTVYSGMKPYSARTRRASTWRFSSS